jgi:GNAT superfamily N-acetyltransferase
MTTPDRLRAIAHESLCLTEAPYLRHYERGRFKLWKGVGFTGSVLPGPGFNFAAVLGPSPPLAEIIATAWTFFDPSTAWGILVEADAGHPIEAELRALNWKIDEDEPAYAMEPIPEQPSGPPELQIAKVATPAEEEEYYAVVLDGFRPPPELANLMRPMKPYFDAPDIALFVGRLDGKPVTAAGYSQSGTTAVVWGVATLESFRGKGYGGAVTRAALAHAKAAGCTAASLRSGPLSRPLYERLGLHYACKHRTYAAPSA